MNMLIIKDKNIAFLKNIAKTCKYVDNIVNKTSKLNV